MSAKSSSMSGLFGNKFVQTILMSGLLLQIGIWVRNYGILLFVMEQTKGDSFAVSMISFAEFAPIFIFSFIGGTFADRWRPKRTMVWCDVLSAVSMFAVLFTLVYGSWKAVFFATLVSAILSQFSQPSGMKLFKLHVPEHLIQAGMSIYQTLFAVFMILGPVIGTFVFQRYGIDYSIAISGIAFLLSAAVLLLLPKDRVETDRKEGASFWGELAEGYRYVRSSKLLSTLGGCFAAAGLGLGLIQPLGIFLVTDRLGLPKEDFQWLMMTSGIAMIVGGGLAMGFAKKVAPQKLLAFGMAVDVVTMSISGFSTAVWLTLVAQFFSGLVLPCIQIGINTMILKNTEERFVGRVNGLLNPLFMGSMVVTMSVSGWLMAQFSLVAMYQAAAVLFVVGALIMVPIFQYQEPVQKADPAQS